MQGLCVRSFLRPDPDPELPETGSTFFSYGRSVLGFMDLGFRGLTCPTVAESPNAPEVRAGSGWALEG